MAPLGEGADRPLAVDLDGTMLASDMTGEAFFALMAARPLALLRTIPFLVRGRGEFKTRLAAQIDLDLGRLPWDRRVLDLLEAERGRGRRIYLASASARSQVEAVARHLGLFEGVFASDGAVNLESTAKAETLVRAFGEGGFDYAGNASADLAVWARAGGVVAVNASGGLLRRVVRRWPASVIVPARPAGAGDYRRAWAAERWAAALLVFLPALVRGTQDLSVWLSCLETAIALIFCMTGAAMLGDLLELGSDRRNPVRCARPFAAGTIPLPRGVRMMLVAFGIALAAVAILPGSLALVSCVLTYLVVAGARRGVPDGVVFAAAACASLVAGWMAAG